MNSNMSWQECLHASNGVCFVVIRGRFCFLLPNFSSLNFTDDEPSNRDLLILVVPEVTDPDKLGTMLDLNKPKIKMIKKKESDLSDMNREILDTWKEEETRTPTTWRTLIQALEEMNMMKLARKLTEKFGGRET